MSFATEDKPPFVFPFLVSLLFGLPFCALWFFTAVQIGVLATLITILLGVGCGFGARISSGGHHGGFAATMATLFLICLTLSAVTIQFAAIDLNISFVDALKQQVFDGDFTQFSNACVKLAGRTFTGYPIALYTAYKVSDPE